MPKTPKSPGARDTQRHNPLADDLNPALKQKVSNKRRKSSGANDGENFTNSKQSRAILQLGQELADEDENENRARRPPVQSSAFDFESRLGEDESDPTVEYGDDDEAWGDEEEEVEEIEIDPNGMEVEHNRLEKNRTSITNIRRSCNLQQVYVDRR